MQRSEENGQKILVTMIGASAAIETEYAFFESYTDESNENNKDVYRKKDEHTDDNRMEKYGYPFWAKIKALTKEECFDQIVFIGTRGSKWESLLSNAKKVADQPQSVTEQITGQKKGGGVEVSGKDVHGNILELMNQYVSQVLGPGYNSVTERELPRIEKCMKGLLTPEEQKREKQKEDQQKHIAYVQNHMSDEHLREYEEELGRNITLAVKGKDDTSPITARVILIKEGRTESENRENIIKIQKALSEIPISEITLDVTNGLRSHPMYVLSIINNISAIGNKAIPVNIYYGMFDAKLKAQKENCYVVPLNPWEGECAPMVDLKEIQEIEKWTRAISEFFSNGSVLEIIELLDAIRKENTEKEHKKIDEWIRAFENFSLAVNSNNLLILETAIQNMDSIKHEMEQLQELEQEVEIPLYVKNCLAQVVLQIWKQFRIGDAEKQTKYSFYMFRLANWYLQQNRLGDSVRSFQEAVVTYIMEKYSEDISELLKKKMLEWPVEGKMLSDFLFDGKIRKIVRDAVFEDDFVIKGREEEYQEWKKWIAEYHYMKEQIHNPDALLYNLSQPGENLAKDGTASGNHIEAAKNAVGKFAEKMPGGAREGKGMFKNRIKYLLDIQYYDIFISYRRSYEKTENGDPLNDGVLLVTALSDYFEKNGLHVFYDKNRMEGVQGEFSEHIQQNLRNSKLCLVILGKDAYARDFAETDEYYKEIIAAVRSKMKIAVICMKGFYMENGNRINYGSGVQDQKELMEVVQKYQRIGGAKFSDQWTYENILSLREYAYEEITKMPEEEQFLGIS